MEKILFFILSVFLIGCSYQENKDIETIASNKIYIANETDTLWGVAQKQYGDPTLWPIIYNFSKEKYGAKWSPDYLCAGMELKIQDITDIDVKKTLAREYYDMYKYFYNPNKMNRAIGFLACSYIRDTNYLSILSNDVEMQWHLKNIILGKE
jgi:hypothetical protein